MTKLNVSYSGFKLGFRVAEQIGLSYVPGDKVQCAALHAIKNLVCANTMREHIGAIGINGKMYKGA